MLSATARVQDAAGSRTRAALTTPAQAASPLALVVTEDANPVLADDDLEYTLRFGNHGADALLGTQLVLTLPAGMSVLDAGGGTVNAGTITWALGTLDPAEIGARLVRVHVEKLAPDDPDVRVARAVIASGATVAEASVVTQVQGTTLGLGITSDPDPVKPGGLPHLSPDGDQPRRGGLRAGRAPHGASRGHLRLRDAVGRGAGAPGLRRRP